MLTLLFFSLVLLLLLGFLLKFAFAEGDFTLISKKEVKRKAMEDKVVWITGANRGIGEALAKQFASLGTKLILSARNEAELFRIKSELKGKYAPEHVKVLRLDLPSSEDRLKNVVERAVSLFPEDGVDYLIHNAAYEGPKSNAVDASEENLETTFGVNVFGTISLTKLVTPHMLKRGGGHFVVISSAAGKVPSPGQAIYAASKHALQGYFHTLRSEFFQKGIKVTVVCPGPIETSNGTGTSTSEDKNSPEMRVSSERCAELTIIAASHNLKEAWISHQPELLVMYLVQYMPSLGLWLMDKVGGKRVEVAEKKKAKAPFKFLFLELQDMTKQTIVLDVTIKDDKRRTKAKKIAGGTKGVNAMRLDEDKEKQNQEKLTVEGEGVDIVTLARTLKKKVGKTDIFQVTPVTPV
ncbi:BnaA05g32570D [Brassica napus]|uniref:BnaA05g32570D protein n=1 Tax=Brassica napus TaxID=3708 RepID=A0A078I0R2_BRANA|nr:BnaA05g32570D [Brassica napus]